MLFSGSVFIECDKLFDNVRKLFGDSLLVVS